MGALYVLGVPIGNYGDLSPRALETLEKADIITAEDPRVTKKLLEYFNLKKPCVLYGAFSDDTNGESPAQCLLRGGNVALVSDAGMPVISDPGVEFISFCRKNGIKVISVPGACAISSALSICGLNVSRFTFEGFLTVNKPNRVKHLNELKNEKRAIVLYEAPKKLPATLKDLFNTLGDRRCALVKELTKPDENCEITSLHEAAVKYDGVKLKGEYVIVIEGI